MFARAYAMLSSRQREQWLRILRLSSVFALNLVVPLSLGLLVTKDDGTIGMVVAIMFCWAALLLACYSNGRLETVVVNGGFEVAFFQFIPILQLVSGLFGLWAWHSIAGDNTKQSADGILFIRGGIAGFAVTILSAQPLLLATWLFGGGVRMMLSSNPVHAAESADYEEKAATSGLTESAIVAKPEQA